MKAGRDVRATKKLGTTDFLARQSRNQKKLNNRDTNYTNFHESLSGHEERLTQIRQNVKTGNHRFHRLHRLFS